MRKFLFAAAIIPSLISPAAAQECITQDMLMAAADERAVPLFYVLHGVDIGFEGKADVLVFEIDATHYSAFAFMGDCFVAQTGFDQEGVEYFINENTRKADGV